MHPTREDTNPLVLLEAASFGCPCITVNSFAIPELVVDGITGLLLDQPASADSVTEALQSLLGAPERVKMLRLAARDRALKQFSWNTIGNELATEILQRMDGSR
jgi:glycosyltransferase involved in cell wall biosynthesis